jgi:RNA polymerase sigma factor (sigma-70 family)
MVEAVGAVKGRSKKAVMMQTEATLLKRFAGSGDADAFAEIIRRHAGLVYGVALRILADADRAADVAQETFLQLVRDAGSVTGSLPGWLHRVATRKAVDQIRRDAARQHREREYMEREVPGATSEWKDISPYIDAALRELDPEWRDVLILHFLEGRTTREIAREQGTSQATISRRIRCGVDQLRASLQKRGIIVVAGVLSTLLGYNSAQAAPLSLLTELGKMALMSGGPGTAGSLTTATGGIVAAVKTHAVAVATVVIVGAGSVITYQQVVKPSPKPPVGVPARSTAPSMLRRAAGPSAASQRPPVPTAESSATAHERDATTNTAPSQTAGSNRNASPPQGPASRPKVATAVRRKTESQPEQRVVVGRTVVAVRPQQNPPGRDALPPGAEISGATARMRPFGSPGDPNDPNASGKP